MKIKFFWKPASGLKADIERHRKEEQELTKKLAELEAQDQNDPMVRAGIRAYRRFLYQLELSKCEVVSKIGKKK